MRSWHWCALVSASLLALSTAAYAQDEAGGSSWDDAAGDFGAPAGGPSEPAAGVDAEANEDDEKAKEPGRGDFDAGGQVRLPNGPDEMGQYATFNWVAVDLQGRYFLLDWATINAEIPLAIIKPSMIGEVDPKLIGGISMDLRIEAPETPFTPKDTKSQIILGGSYMREGAMLLSKRDYPLFSGSFKPGLVAGVTAHVKLSSLFDFQMAPVFVYQAGTGEGLQAVQLPTSTIIKLGSLLELGADLGVYTGDDFSFKGSNGGRISAGGSLEVKIGPILAHAGAGAASLLTGGLYPSIGESLYVDLNVKYVK